MTGYLRYMASMKIGIDIKLENMKLMQNARKIEMGSQCRYIIKDGKLVRECYK